MGDLGDFVLAGGRLVRCAIYTRQSVNSYDDLSSCQVQLRALRVLGTIPALTGLAPGLNAGTRCRHSLVTWRSEFRFAS
jgi:hypothetical protein